MFTINIYTIYSNSGVLLPQRRTELCCILIILKKPISAFEEGVLSVMANFEVVHERDSIH